jgi:hypothetical protein
LEPAAGSWYRLVDKEDLFRVVSIDGDNDTIEIRWFEGEREEIDSGAWFEMDLEEAEAPEGWTDPDDDDDDDDDDDGASDDEDEDDWDDDDTDDDDDWDDGDRDDR